MHGLYWKPLKFEDSEAILPAVTWPFLGVSCSTRLPPIMRAGVLNMFNKEISNLLEAITLYVQKPDIYRCICSNHDRVGFSVEIQIIFRTVYCIVRRPLPSSTHHKTEKTYQFLQKSNVKLDFSFSCKQTANERQKVFSYVKKSYKSFLFQWKPLNFSFSTSLRKNRR